MKKEKALLVIKTEKLGTVEEIITFLKDIEIVYNNIYRFNHVVNTVQRCKHKPRLNKVWNNIKLNKIMPHEDRLCISSVCIQSPGEWNFKGAPGVIYQFREAYKYWKYRRQEGEMRDLEIEEKELQILERKARLLREYGYSDTKIRNFISSKLDIPMRQLLKHEEQGLIDDVDVVPEEVRN